MALLSATALGPQARWEGASSVWLDAEHWGTSVEGDLEESQDGIWSIERAPL